MSVIWLAPAALLGLILCVVPVLIHLLTNQQTRHVPFPTLRFLRTTRLAAMRRRSVQNWLLLAVRLLIVTTAVGALAGPVFVSEIRQAEWRQRVARAIVIAPGGAASAVVDPLIESERRDSFAIEVFRPATRVADGLREAAVWLQAQAPASQEIVVVGDLRRGAIVPEDLSLAPPRAGVRFLPLPPAVSNRDVDLHFQEADAMWRARTTLHDTSTRVSYLRAGAAEQSLTVRAAANEQAAADAALNAVLTRGLDADAAERRRVVVVFAGARAEDLPLTAPPRQAWMRDALAALPETTGGASGEALVVQTKRRGSDRVAAQFLERVARVVVANDRRHSALEPASISVQTLAEWSRPPGAFESGRPADEGDRRWLWAAALLLMAIETVMRRSRSASAEPRDVQEARVA
jgi:hypothetical protein